MAAAQRKQSNPKGLLVRVYVVLVVLTIVTLLLAQLSLGVFGVFLALLIAFIQIMLVARNFMSLRYDDKLYTVVLSLGVLSVLVFLGLTLLDTAFRSDFGNMDSKTVSEQQREEEVLRSREPAPETQRVAPADFPTEIDAETEAE